MSVSGDEDVLGFEVAIDDTCGMETFAAFDDFCSVEARSVATESTTSCELSGKITSRMEVLYPR